MKKPESQKFLSILNVLGHVSRCILADFTQPQTMLEAAEYLATRTTAPFLPLLAAEETKEPALLPRLRAQYSNILPTFTYANTGELSAMFEQQTVLPMWKRVQSGLSLSDN